MKVLCATLALSLMFFGCLKSKDKDTEIDKWLKELNDQGTMIEYNKSDIKDFFEVHNSEDFIALGQNFDSTFSFADCLKNYIGPSVLISADKNTIQYTINSDVSECVKQEYKYGNENMTFHSIKANFFKKLIFYCENADYSAYNGKSFKDLPSIIVNRIINSVELNCNQGVLKQLIYTKLYQKLDTSNYKQESQLYSALLNPTTKEACEGNASNGVITWQDGCTGYYKIHYRQYQFHDPLTNKIDVSLEGKTDYQKYVTKNNLKAPTTPPQGYTQAWYSGGEVEVFINGWKGKVVFSSPTTSPTYEVTKDGETVAGTLPDILTKH